MYPESPANFWDTISFCGYPTIPRVKRSEQISLRKAMFLLQRYLTVEHFLQTSLYYFEIASMHCRGRWDGAVVRALASYQCGSGLIPGLGVICGLSLLFVLVLALRGFSPGTPVFLSPQKPTFPNSIRFGLLSSTLS